MKELTTHLSQEHVKKLQNLAEKTGKTTEKLVAELVEQELKIRTKPRSSKGNLRAFRRA
ncbi:hypothetical protein [Microbulbifer sp. TYP-18]|uniref:hypothetical protein n=1 Tax=Microbulbifer sp. TYP-18 TaxID=3230024 RepID=UPI0034C6CBAB